MIGFKDWYDDWVYLYQDKKKKIRRRIYIQCQLTIKLHISSQLLSIKGTVGVFRCPIFYEFVFFLRTLFTKKLRVAVWSSIFTGLYGTKSLDLF